MAQYWIEIASDTALSQFTREFMSGSDLTEIVTDGAFQALKFDSTATANGTLAWDTVVSAANMEVMALLRRDSTSTSRFHGPAGRVSAGVNAYISRMRGSSGSGLQLLEDGDSIQLQSTSSSVATVTEYHWRKLGLTGTTVSEKVWTGAVTAEPVDWLVSVTDSTLTSGGAGLGSTGAHLPIYVRILSVGTDGDPAPTGPIAPPIWTPSMFAAVALAATTSHLTAGANSTTQATATAGTSSQTHLTAGANSTTQATATAGTSSVGVSGAPTLSSPGVIDITANSARPQVTLTY